MTPMGLPAPFTGNFSNVYRMRCNDRVWAVKCFLRNFQDQQDRYEAIHRGLADARLPCTMGFNFLPEGIRIRRQWYPILKMEWVEGENLLDYIDRNYQNSQQLEHLASQWKNMLASLRRHQIAHGDLQHGNVLVIGDELRLIDYDGMYVPELKGRISHELGHDNYRHPSRNANDFGDYLDNFPAWIIYVSMLAISKKSDLWKSYRNDDQLLFRKKDFEKPASSELFKELKSIEDDRIYPFISKFDSYCALQEISKIPPLESTDVCNLETPDHPWWTCTLEENAQPVKSEPAPSDFVPPEPSKLAQAPAKIKRRTISSSLITGVVFSLIGGITTVIYKNYSKITSDNLYWNDYFKLIGYEEASFAKWAIIGIMIGAIWGAFQPIQLFNQEGSRLAKILASLICGTGFGLIFGTLMYSVFLYLGIYGLSLQASPPWLVNDIPIQFPITLIGSYLVTMLALSRVKRVIIVAELEWPSKAMMAFLWIILGIFLATMTLIATSFAENYSYSFEQPLYFKQLLYNDYHQIIFGGFIGFFWVLLSFNRN